MLGRMLSPTPCSIFWMFGLAYTVAVSTSLPPDILLYEYDICSSEPVPTGASLSQPGDFIEIYVKWIDQPATRESYSCSAYFETCDHCHIKVNAVEPWFNYPECRQTGTENRCVPGCIYMIVSDANYKSLRQRKFSHSLAVSGFASISKRLRVVACGNHIYPLNITMRLRLTSVEKVQLFSGNIFEPHSRQTLMSPDFPNPYVRNNEHYTFKFQSSTRLNKYVTLIFDDWMMSPFSSIQFDGANIINRITGDNVRPYIISEGKSMTMTFSTGEHRKVGSTRSFLGFKALVQFYNSHQDIPNIVTGCDSLVTNSKGGILHLNAAADGLNRDCIWVIRKVPNFDGVYLKIIRYRTRYELKKTCEYSLEVCRGLTSAASPCLQVTPNEQVPNNGVFLSKHGFYIRIKGCYFDDSVVVSYAMYSDDCDDYREYYKCDNGQCIPEHLKCDTYDHCGDNSDEIRSMCDYSTNNVSNASSGSYDYSVGIHVIIPLMVSIILGIGIICLVIILIRRCRRLNNATYGGHPLNVQRPRGARHTWGSRGVQMSVTMRSGEHPPSYEDVIRTTPIGHLNMAFSWSTSEHAFTQPPSYEEAVSPASGTFHDTLIISANTDDGGREDPEETVTTFEQHNSPPVIPTRNSNPPSPQVDIAAPSSACGGSSGDNQHLEIPTSAETSAGDEHSPISNNNNVDNIIPSNGESNSQIKPQRSIAKYLNRAKVVLDFSVFLKTKAV